MLKFVDKNGKVVGVLNDEDTQPTMIEEISKKKVKKTKEELEKLEEEEETTDAKLEDC